jgi:hypothetical protein
MKCPPDLFSILRDFAAEIAQYTRFYSGERKYSENYDITVFSQEWGSTAMCFGGWGGQAVTTAYVVVMTFLPTGIVGVYVDGKLAYLIHNPNNKFFEDIRDRHIIDVRMKSLYEKNKKDFNDEHK